MAALVDEHDDTLERLRAAVVGLFTIVASTTERSYVTVVAREHLRLAQRRPPDDVRAILSPLLDPLVREVRAAAAAGVVTSDDPERDALIVFHLVRGHLHGLVLGHVDGDPAEVGAQLWAFCARALGVRT